MRTRSLKLLVALAVVIGIANVGSTASAKISASTINLNQNVRIVGIQPRIARRAQQHQHDQRHQERH